MNKMQNILVPTYIQNIVPDTWGKVSSYTTRNSLVYMFQNLDQNYSINTPNVNISVGHQYKAQYHSVL